MVVYFGQWFVALGGGCLHWAVVVFHRAVAICIRILLFTLGSGCSLLPVVAYTGQWLFSQGGCCLHKVAAVYSLR